MTLSRIPTPVNRRSTMSKYSKQLVVDGLADAGHDRNDALIAYDELRKVIPRWAEEENFKITMAFSSGTSQAMVSKWYTKASSVPAISKLGLGQGEWKSLAQSVMRAIADTDRYNRKQRKRRAAERQETDEDDDDDQSESFKRLKISADVLSPDDVIYCMVKGQPMSRTGVPTRNLVTYPIKIQTIPVQDLNLKLLQERVHERTSFPEDVQFYYNDLSNENITIPVGTDRQFHNAIKDMMSRGIPQRREIAFNDSTTQDMRYLLFIKESGRW